MSGVFVYVGESRVALDGELVTIGHVPDPVYTPIGAAPDITLRATVHRYKPTKVTASTAVVSADRRVSARSVVPVLEVVAVGKVP